LEWAKIFLRGVGQVFFQENALTGLLFLIGIAAASPLMGAGALLGTLIGTVTAKLLKYDEGELRAGIYGFNATLVGIAVLFYLELGVGTALLLVVGCAASTVVTWAMRKYLPFPTYTFPFIVTTWLLLALASHPLMNLPWVKIPDATETLNTTTFLQGITEGVGEVMFQASLITGIFFLAGLAVSNWRHAVLGFVGSVLGTLVGIYHQDPSGPITIGIYGYNAVLAAIALYLWRKSLVIPILGAFLTTPLTELFPKIHDFIPGFDPAALTAPFVFACWIVIGIGAFEKYFCEPSS
jgi:urea transporter